MIILIPLILIVFLLQNNHVNKKLSEMQLTKDFNLSEFTKNGNDLPLELLDNMKLLTKNLQVLRDHLNEPIHVNSGYRSPEYNKKIGGVPNSQHTKGKASDITVGSLTPHQLHGVIESLIAQGKMMQGGLGLYPTFVHYDVRGTRARWNG